MVYTVTFNPSIDYIMTVSPFKEGETNRTSAERFTAGGKGINVSLALRNLGVETTAIAFTAGWTGREIERQLTESGLPCEFIRVDGESRINVKIKSGVETEINGRGAAVDEAAFARLLDKLGRLRAGDVLALSGNAAIGTAEDVYTRIMSSVPSGVAVTVDAHGDLLKSVLPLRPLLIKPNLDELCGIFGRNIGDDEIGSCAEELRQAGARNVIVSLGAGGAVLASECGVHRLAAPRGKLVNSTGAGDTLVAGFIAEYLRSGDVLSSFAYGVAAGSACAFMEGFPRREEVEIYVGTAQ